MKKFKPEKLDKIALGNKIKSLRTTNGLDVKEFAALLNITKTYLNRVENGDAIFGLEKLCFISKIFSISLNDLLGVEIDENEDIDTINYFDNDNIFETVFFEKYTTEDILVFIRLLIYVLNKKRTGRKHSNVLIVK